MEYLALSIMYPAVQHILSGYKKIEIRSWVPSNSLPIRDLILVENNIYLNDGDVDINGTAVAMVDIVSYKKLSLSEFNKLDATSTLNKKWRSDYYSWEIANVRSILPTPCIAMRDIYSIQINIDNLKTIY